MNFLHFLISKIDRQMLILFSFGFLVIALGALLLWGPAGRTLGEFAAQIMIGCEESPYRSTCYNELIPKYFNKVGMVDSFKLIRKVQQSDKAYGYCHLAAHEVARQAVEKNRLGWKSVLNQCPQDGMCANGCLHGALITRFIGAESGMSRVEIDEAIGELEGICEPRSDWDPSPLDRGNCYHGLGHLSMYMTLGDIHESIKICNRFSEGTEGDMNALCYGGVFMQLFQPLEPEDVAMVAHIDVSRENFVDFCNQFPQGGGRTECFERGSMLFPRATTDGPTMKHFCELSKDKQIIESCYIMVFSLVGSGSDYDTDRIKSICDTVEEVRRGDCYGLAAINMIDADSNFISRIPEICKATGDEDTESACFARIAWYVPYRFNSGTDNFDSLCDVLKESSVETEACFSE